MRILSLVLMPLLFVCGCASIEFEPGGDPDRVVTGRVNFSGSIPANSVLTVRVIDNSDPAMGPRILGEQAIVDPGTSPVAFRVEFRAEDPLLRRGVALEARIAVGGKLRYSNASASAVTDTNVSSPREIWLIATGG